MALVNIINEAARYAEGPVAAGHKFNIVDYGEPDFTLETESYTDVSGTQLVDGNHVTPDGRLLARTRPDKRVDVVWVETIDGVLVEHSRHTVIPTDCHMTDGWEILEPLQGGWKNSTADPVRWTFGLDGLVALRGTMEMPTDPADYDDTLAMFALPTKTWPEQNARFPMVATGGTNFDFFRIVVSGAAEGLGIRFPFSGTPGPSGSLYLHATWLPT
jgi:hypothetical protein